MRASVPASIAALLSLALAGCDDDLLRPAGETGTIETPAPLAAVVDGDTRVVGDFGGGESHAMDINNEGMVVGWALNDEGDRRAFRYFPTGIIHDLGVISTVAGADRSQAHGINDAGTIVGISDQYLPERDGIAGDRAFLWRNDDMDLLPPLPDDFLSVAWDINDAGLVVGHSGGEAPVGGTSVVWRDGTPEALPGPDAQGSALAVSDHDWIVGYLRIVDPGLGVLVEHAVLWRDGGFVDLGTFGGRDARAVDVNVHGVVLVHRTTGSAERAFVWDDGELLDLGTLGGASTVPRALNDRGWVVGDSETASGATEPFLWTPSDGMESLAAATELETAVALTDDLPLRVAGEWDELGAWAEVDFVANRPPRGAAGEPYTGVEGAAIAFDGTGTTDPDDDPLTYTWDFGDGGTATGAEPTHTYADDGKFHVSLTVSDGHLEHTAHSSATVENVAPTATLVAPESVVATEAFAISLTPPYDPSPADREAGFTHAFDCGDGNGYAEPGESNSTICVAREAGTTTVRAKVFDKDGGAGEYAAEVKVLEPNLPPTATFEAPSPVAEGAGFTLALTDPVDAPADVAAGFTYAFDCGDGTGYGPSGTVGTTTCDAADDDVRHVRATLRDQAGASSEYEATVRIENVAPVLGPIEGAELLAGERYEAEGSFEDPGDDSWTATVDYGESGDATLPLAGRTFRLAHVYATPGTFTVRVVASDDDGGEGRGEAVVVVLDAAAGTEALEELVEELATSGELRRGEAQALGNSLRAARRSLERGNETAALNQLRAVSNKLRAMVRSGRMNEETAARLQAEVDRIVRSVRAVGA